MFGRLDRIYASKIILNIIIIRFDDLKFKKKYFYFLLCNNFYVVSRYKVKNYYFEFINLY